MSAPVFQVSPALSHHPRPSVVQLDKHPGFRWLEVVVAVFIIAAVYLVVG